MTIFSQTHSTHPLYISGNITTLLYNITTTINIKDLLPKQHNLYKRDTTNFKKDDFILDLLEIDWIETLQLNKNDPNFSFDQFYENVNNIIDMHLPLKKVSKKELKQQFKPWITAGIRKSIKIRDQLFKKFITSKNHNKEIIQNEYKRYRNLIVKLTRISQKNHYQLKARVKAREPWKNLGFRKNLALTLL